MVVPRKIVILNLDWYVDNILKYGKSLRENIPDVGFYSFFASTLGREFSIRSEQNITIHLPENNLELSVYLNGSGGIKTFKFEQLLEKLISEKIIALNQGPTDAAADIGEVPKELSKKYVFGIKVDHCQIEVCCKDGKVYYISPMGRYLEGSLMVKLLEHKPQLAPLFGIEETLGLRIKEREHKFRKQDIPSNIDFREFSELIFLYRLMYDISNIEDLREKYMGIRSVGIKQTPKVVSYDDGKPTIEVVPDLIDGRPVKSSSLYRMLYNKEVDGILGPIEKRYDKLWSKYNKFFEIFLKEVNKL